MPNTLWMRPIIIAVYIFITVFSWNLSKMQKFAWTWQQSGSVQFCRRPQIDSRPQRTRISRGFTRWSRVIRRDQISRQFSRDLWCRHVCRTRRCGRNRRSFRTESFSQLFQLAEVGTTSPAGSGWDTLVIDISWANFPTILGWKFYFMLVFFFKFSLHPSRRVGCFKKSET